MPLFEIHLSVDPDQYIPLQAYCAEHGHKMILVKNSHGLNDWQLILTLWISRDTGKAAIYRALDLKKTFSSAGFSILRTKVEYELNDSKIPEDLEVMQCYYEFHLKIPTKDRIAFEALMDKSEVHQVKWSVLVQSKESQFLPIATIRTEKTTLEKALAAKNKFMDMLKANGIHVHQKMHQELCIFYDNPGLDAGW